MITRLKVFLLDSMSQIVSIITKLLVENSHVVWLRLSPSRADS